MNDLLTTNCEHFERNLRYETKVNYDPEGKILGAMLFLGADDLRELGVEASDESIEYRIEGNGTVAVSEGGGQHE